MDVVQSLGSKEELNSQRERVTIFCGYIYEM
jgi:hypothetical protein